MYNKIITLLSILVSILLVLALIYHVALFASARSYSFDGFRITDKSPRTHSHKEPSDSAMRARIHQLSALLNKNAFLTNRSILARQDSIYLSFQIADSTLSLEMKGVPLYTSKVTRITMSGIFKDIPDSILNAWLSTPFTIRHHESSIPKEDIIFRKAPKDTLEYLSTQTTPEAPKFDPTYFRLSFDRGLDLYVEQSEPAARAKRNFYRGLRRTRLKNNLDSLISGKLPAYTPWIKIEISQKDALSIYRSLPGKGYMALSFK